MSFWLRQCCVGAAVFVGGSATVCADGWLDLAQSPAGAGFRPPAPNVIVSVDDSGSMGTSGMSALKRALWETFTPHNVPDYSIRLGYMALNDCPSIPFVSQYGESTRCAGHNHMQPFYGNADVQDDSPRGQFLDWVDSLYSLGGTPTHGVVRQAGQYLRTTGPDSPWNATPGHADDAPLPCRKAFHVLMTDGGWNSFYTEALEGAEQDSLRYDNAVDNIDGTQRVLPDGAVYDPTSDQAGIYADPWGRQSTYVDGAAWGEDGRSYASLQACAAATQWCEWYEYRENSTTLSDEAFYFWAIDLQPQLENKVPASIRHSGPETYAGDHKSVNLSEYWNPKNNPATWQHLVQYTIGFNAAATWPRLDASPEIDPQFEGDHFSGDLGRLAVGERQWGNVTQPNIYSPTGSHPSYYAPTVLHQAPFYNGTDESSVRQQEMWHMALNSRGKFVPAKTPDDLVQAFKDIVAGIVTDNTSATTSYSAASSSVSMRGTSAYASYYDAKGWQGGVKAFSLSERTAQLGVHTGWGEGAAGQSHSTADKLDALTEAQVAQRVVLTHNGAEGVPFVFDSLSPAQQSLLARRRHSDAAPDDLGPARAAFLRGSRALEGQSLRKRLSRHGDIVNSSIWYIGAPSLGLALPGYSAFAAAQRQRIPMLYVGANDGMLHGYSAEDGAERIAYVPQGVYPYLSDLTDPAYTHRYYVDGSPFTGDVFLHNATGEDADKWRTYLVSPLGAGGTGFFVLDVTRPGSQFAADNASALVVLDETGSSDPDIGHIFGAPVTDDFNSQHSTQITRLNNGRWAVLLGNGYNSTHQRPVLLVQYLDGARERLKLVATSAGPEASGNGLSTPRVVDINGDGNADVVYAGDVRGNVWKFQLLGPNDSEWGVALGGQALFTAAYSAPTLPGEPAPAAVRQPITTAPLVRASSSAGGLMVAFGTGQDLTVADRTNAQVQSFYSVLDTTVYEMVQTGSTQGTLRVVGTHSAVTQGRAQLAQRVFSEQPLETGAQGTSFWNMPETDETTNPTVNYGEGQRGWYLDFPAHRERVVRHPRIYVGGSAIIEILSDSPSIGESIIQESCEAHVQAAQSWRTLLGVEFGAAPNQQIMDANADGVYSLQGDARANRMTASSSELRVRTRGEQVRVTQGGNTQLADLVRPQRTLNWRQFR